ncbi:Nn.00g037710.m01.CDS01 [Neocucurbitaria sp. VM-36]
MLELTPVVEKLGLSEDEDESKEDRSSEDSPGEDRLDEECSGDAGLGGNEPGEDGPGGDSPSEEVIGLEKGNCEGELMGETDGGGVSGVEMLEGGLWTGASESEGLSTCENGAEGFPIGSVRVGVKALWIDGLGVNGTPEVRTRELGDGILSTGGLGVGVPAVEASGVEKPSVGGVAVGGSRLEGLMLGELPTEGVVGRSPLDSDVNDEVSLGRVLLGTELLSRAVAEGEISVGSFADCSSSLGRDVRDMGSGPFEDPVGEVEEALTS